MVLPPHNAIKLLIGYGKMGKSEDIAGYE